MNFNNRNTFARKLLIVPFVAPQLLVPISHAQTPFPNKVIKLIFPVAPGGGADALARMVTEKMSQSLGTPIIIDNKAGASGLIAATEVARATPDGYTLMQCFVATQSTNPAVLKLKYDPIADFLLVVIQKNKAKKLPEFLAQPLTRPGGCIKSCRSINLHSTKGWPLISSGSRAPAERTSATP